MQSLVIAECTVLQDDLLQEFDKLIGQVCGHESLDGSRDILWILTLGKCSGCDLKVIQCHMSEWALMYRLVAYFLANLIDQLASMLIVFLEYICPQGLIAATDKVSCLVLEH